MEQWEPDARVFSPGSAAMEWRRWAWVLVKLPDTNHNRLMAKRIKLTDDQIKQVEGMAKVRLPTEMMATILEISKDTFERLLKRDAALRAAIDRGRSNGSGKVRNTLFSLATQERHVVEKTKMPDGTVRIKEWTETPDVSALKFWCQTQEGFKSADRIEISGPDGKPIEVRELTKEERLATLKELNRKLKLTEDE